MNFDIPTLKAPLPRNHTRHSIPHGSAGTAETIRHMQALVTQGKRDFRIRSLAAKIIRSVPEKDYAGYAKAIHNWIRSRVKYAFDPVGVELLESPWRIVEAGIADCDSSSILNAALAESIGLPARFVTIKADTNKPDEFSHVFTQVKIPRKGWMTSDCTMNHGFGWDPGPNYPRQTWPASQDAPEDMDGDAMSGFAADEVDAEFVRCLGNLPIAAGSLDGLQGMGAADSTLTVLQKIADGSYAAELHQRNEQARRQFADIQKLADSIKRMPDTFKKHELLGLLAQARKTYSDSRFAIDAAVIKYNIIVDEMNRWGFNNERVAFGPPGGLGAAPAIPAGLLMVAGLAAACAALSVLIYNIGGAINNTDGFITQIAGAIRATGGTIDSTGGAINQAGTGALKFAGAGVIVGAVVLGFLLLKKGGRI